MGRRAPLEPGNVRSCQGGAAPTACFPYGYTYEDEIKQNMLDAGMVLGLEDKAAENIPTMTSAWPN